MFLSSCYLIFVLFYSLELINKINNTKQYNTTQDIVDPIIDEQLALFVVNSHMRSHPDMKDGLLEEEKETVTDGLTKNLG